MLVTHFYHSGNLVELEHHSLLFDYYQGELHLNKEKPLYVFVSHRHYDHYNPAIFKIDHPHITYILSSDLRHKYDGHYVNVHHHYTFDDIQVDTLLSTDEGCAFIVKVEDKTIYFAGDLNWWHWNEEPDQDNEFQKVTYQKEIDSIKQPLDLAFVVVDKRQEEHYLLGLQYFLNHVQAKYIMPIHYFGDYSITQQLQKEKLDNTYQAHIIPIKHQDETFEII